MTIETNGAVVAYLNSIRHVDANGHETFVDPLYGPHIATDRAGCPARTVPEIVAWTKTHRSYLWNETTAPTAPAAPAAASSTTADPNWSEMMLAAKQGVPGALERIDAAMPRNTRR